MNFKPTPEMDAINALNSKLNDLAWQARVINSETNNPQRRAFFDVYVAIQARQRELEDQWRALYMEQLTAV